jgi:multidrug resistance efflux pump
MDLRLVRGDATGLFRLCDPQNGKFVELYELECLVAQAMDGQRTLNNLTAFARNYNPAITQSQIEKLLMHLLHLGLLDEPIKPGHGKIIPLPIPKPNADEFAAFRNELVLDFQGHDALNWTEAPSPVARTPLLEATRRPSRAVIVAQPEPEELDLDANTALESLDDDSSPFASPFDDEAEHGETVLRKATDPFGALEAKRDRMVRTGQIASEPYPSYPPQPPPVPAPQPEPEPEDAEPPANIATPVQAEAEQEELFKQSLARKKRWYQRGSVRFLMVLAAITIVASIVHRPLRVTSDCAIIPSQRAYVRSPIGGVLAEILVDEGTLVKKGDVLARLDDRQLNTDRRKAIAEIEKIKAELQKLKQGARKEEIAQARAVVGARASEVAFAQKEAKRRARAVSEGVGSKQQADQAMSDYMVKQNAYAEAAAALRLLQSGTRPEEVRALEADLKRAEVELEFIDQKIADMVVIRAPMDGVVLTAKFRERLHENIPPGGLVCEIANMKTVRAEVFVLERDIDSIELGMPVTVKVESFPGHPFEGKVDFIAPAVEVRDKVNVVRVVAVLDNSEGLLRQDMTGYGEIEAGEKSLLDLATRRLMRWIRVRFLI